MNNQWYNETLYSDYGQRFKVEKILFETKTAYQHLIIFENNEFGRILALDGNIQTTTRDEHIYHEMMTHVPIYAHGKVKKVLIIGGGDGGILRETLKHPSVEQVTMVEIDEAVINMSKQFLPSISQDAFDDKRLNLIIDDGMEYVKKSDEKYDIIITDSTDPIGPGEILFTQDFYSSAKQRLNPDGIVISQNGVSFLQQWELEGTYRRLSSLYQDASFFLACVPTYIGGFMSLAYATDNPDHRRHSLDAIQHRFDQHPVKTKYYNPAIHVASFALPQKVIDMISDVDNEQSAKAVNA